MSEFQKPSSSNFPKPLPRKSSKNKTSNVLNTTSISKTRSVAPRTVDRPINKTKNVNPTMKKTVSKNLINDLDVTRIGNLKVGSEQDYSKDYAALTYNNMLTSIFAETLLDESTSRERSNLDIQMSELANRFSRSINLLDKTNKRLREISFASEKQRLLAMSENSIGDFVQSQKLNDVENLIENLTDKQKSAQDRLELKNVDMALGSGHKQLSDALNEAIQGFEDIKNHSKLDLDILKSYDECRGVIEDCRNDNYDIEGLKRDLEEVFPKIDEKLLIDASDRFARLIEGNPSDSEGDSD